LLDSAEPSPGAALESLELQPVARAARLDVPINQNPCVEVLARFTEFASLACYHFNMNRKLLVPTLIGTAVLAAAIVLVMLLRNENPAPPQTTTAVAAPAANIQPATSPQMQSVQSPLDAGIPTAIAADDPRRTVERDGMVIHDHRDKPTAATDPTPVINRPGGRLLPPAVANQLSDVVRAGVMECANAVPASAKGKDPTVSAHIQVAIKAGKMSVVSVDEPMAHDVDKSATAELNKCLSASLGAATMDVTDEADIASYPITLQFAIPAS
jgi:hypothetical protein